MTTSMFPQEGAPRDPQSGTTEARREAPSFADISGEFPDPVLLERQQRLRRVVGGVMVGAVGLLFIAGICGLVRRGSGDDTAHVAPASPAIATAEPTPPPAEPVAAAASPVEAVPPEKPAPTAARAPVTPVNRAVRHSKPAPKSGSAAALVRPH